MTETEACYAMRYVVPPSFSQRKRPQSCEECAFKLDCPRAPKEPVEIIPMPEANDYEAT